MRTKPTDPFSGEPLRACDCWRCRYSKMPYAVGACPHPHYPHQGHGEEKAAYLAALEAGEEGGGE